MTAKEACEAIEKGLKNIDADAQIVKVPMADGGEGTVPGSGRCFKRKNHHKKVTGPLNKPVTAFYGTIEQKRLAVIEMSAASGIQFVNHDTADPLHATTYGTGELILDALQRGAEEFIIGLGGSATNDGGAGMAQALGVRFLTKTIVNCLLAESRLKNSFESTKRRCRLCLTKQRFRLHATFHVH